MFATRHSSRILSAVASQGKISSVASRSKYTLVLVRHGESTWNQVTMQSWTYLDLTCSIFLSSCCYVPRKTNSRDGMIVRYLKTGTKKPVSVSISSK